jgi:hypothetical protein
VYAVLALLGIAAAVGGASYGMFLDGGRVGPGFIPVVAGVLAAVLCGWIALRSLRTQAVEHEGLLTETPPGLADLGATEAPASAALAADEPDITGRTQRQRTRNLWTVFGLTFGAILLVQAVGFLVAFAVLVVVIATAVERQPLLRSAAIAAVAAGVVYLVFGVFLGVPLPGGFLGLGTEG